MKIDREKYLAHIKDNNKIMEMRKLIDKIEGVINNHILETTDFLDPYERFLANSILNRFDEIGYSEFGGLNNSERKIILIYPFYYVLDDISDNISYLRISGDLDNLSHKDFLGGILNLGIKRSKVGDILVHTNYTDLIVKKEISGFILINLDRIGNKKIDIVEIRKADLEEPDIEFKEINRFVSSLRLDVVISTTYNLSRQESMNIIKSGNVKVNWEPIDKPSRDIKEGDVISIRGYGRVKVQSIGGLSKKGRINVSLRILI